MEMWSWHRVLLALLAAATNVCAEWADAPASAPHSFICEAAPGTPGLEVKDGWQPQDGGSLLKVFGHLVPYPEAKAACEALGSRLFVPNTEAKTATASDFCAQKPIPVKMRFAYNGAGCWVGLEEDAGTETWRWVDGTALDGTSYTAWKDGFPRTGLLNRQAEDFDSAIVNYDPRDYNWDMFLGLPEEFIAYDGGFLLGIVISVMLSCVVMAVLSPCCKSRQNKVKAISKEANRVDLQERVEGLARILPKHECSPKYFSDLFSGRFLEYGDSKAEDLKADSMNNMMNFALVTALLLTCAMAGYLEGPASDDMMWHYVENLLWCYSTYFLLFSTILAVFMMLAINELSNNDEVTMFKVVMGPFGTRATFVMGIMGFMCLVAVTMIRFLSKFGAGHHSGKRIMVCGILCAGIIPLFVFLLLKIVYSLHFTHLATNYADENADPMTFEEMASSLKTYSDATDALDFDEGDCLALMNASGKRRLAGQRLVVMKRMFEAEKEKKTSLILACGLGKGLSM